MKKKTQKNPNTLGKVPKYNRTIAETGKIDIRSAYIHARLLSFLGTRISIKQ